MKGILNNSIKAVNLVKRHNNKYNCIFWAPEYICVSIEFINPLFVTVIGGI